MRALTPAIDRPGSHTAILFFSHRPAREWQNKRFVRQDYAKSRRVAEAFYQHARRAVNASGLPVLEVNGADQRGSDFGTRLANAVGDAFDRGYDRVIVVGSDCPRLHEVNWDGVTQRLEEGRPVLGPTPDEDGTYLIGLRRSHFEESSFAALPWTSSRLLAALARHLTQAAGTKPAFLAPRDDVNGEGELRALLRSSSTSLRRLVATLRRVLGPTGHAPRFDSATPTSRRPTASPRGPPHGRRSRRLVA